MFLLYFVIIQIKKNKLLLFQCKTYIEQKQKEFDYLNTTRKMNDEEDVNQH
jgi:hypothetical protein